jgi:ParB-like chromosome segregation protein Spo0J
VPPALADAGAPDGRVEPVANRPASFVRPGKKIRPELKQPAEDLRYKAALARIDADRLNARQTAPLIFGEGEQSEKEGAKFLQQRDYDAAQMAFSRAAQLFQKAQEVSFQERVRDTSLSANP